MLFFPAPEPVKMVYRTVSGANDKAGANRSRNIFFGQRYRSFEHFTTGQISGDSGRKRAAGAMGISAVDAHRPQHPEILPVEKEIQRGSLAMAAFDHDGPCSHHDDSARRFFK